MTTATAPVVNTAQSTESTQSTHSTQSTRSNANRMAGMRAMMPSLLRSVALPAGAYYALHAFGASDVTALLAGTAVSGVVLVSETVKARRFDPFSAFMLGVFAIGLITMLFTGDARFLIIKDSFGTLAVGAAFLGSTVIGKPLTYLAARKAMAGGDPSAEVEFEEKYRTLPGFRRTMKRISAIWGVGMLAEGSVRIALAYLLPISTMVWLSTVLMVGTIGGLILITKRVAVRAQRRAAVNA
ncbi:MAG: hypothetical protein J2O49_00560 [Sciscionella sp.]|nr:hypothetical protein [Sciscionella sp.]